MRAAALSPTLILTLYCARIAYCIKIIKFLDDVDVTEIVADLLNPANAEVLLTAPPTAPVQSLHPLPSPAPSLDTLVRQPSFIRAPLPRTSPAIVPLPKPSLSKLTSRVPSFLRSAIEASSSHVGSAIQKAAPVEEQASRAAPVNSVAPSVNLNNQSQRVPGKFQEWQTWSELVYLPNKSFLFCALPKSGCTSWKLLLLRASGSPHGHASDGSLIHDPVHSGLRLVGVRRGMHSRDPAARNMSDIASIIANPDIFHAAIVRDPVTRVLSAYLDRCVDNNEWARCFSTGPVSFSQTIAGLERSFHSNERGRVQDVHFRRQIDMCGLRYMNYSFVGRFENFFNDSKHILQRAGLWEKFGRRGWGHGGAFPFGAEVQVTSNHVARHETVHLVCQHYTPKLLERVHKLYKRDFEAFNYSTDVWTSTCDAVWRKRKRPRHIFPKA